MLPRWTAVVVGIMSLLTVLTSRSNTAPFPNFVYVPAGDVGFTGGDVLLDVSADQSNSGAVVGNALAAASVEAGHTHLKLRGTGTPPPSLVAGGQAQGFAGLRAFIDLGGPAPRRTECDRIC